MFGKKVSEYLSFQKVVLILLVAMGLTRLTLSLAGAPPGLIVWCSMNLVSWTGAFWYGYAAHRTGFGGYKQLLPLGFFQGLVFHLVAVAGILVAIAGYPNVFAAPEFSGPAAGNQWLHIAAHLTIGLVAVTLLTWGASCLSMLISRKVRGGPPVLARA